MQEDLKAKTLGKESRHRGVCFVDYALLEVRARCIDFASIVRRVPFRSDSQSDPRAPSASRRSKVKEVSSRSIASAKVCLPQ